MLPTLEPRLAPLSQQMSNGPGRRLGAVYRISVGATDEVLLRSLDERLVLVGQPAISLLDGMISVPSGGLVGSTETTKAPTWPSSMTPMLVMASSRMRSSSGANSLISRTARMSAGFLLDPGGTPGQGRRWRGPECARSPRRYCRRIAPAPWRSCRPPSPGSAGSPSGTWTAVMGSSLWGVATTGVPSRSPATQAGSRNSMMSSTSHCPSCWTQMT